MVPPPPSGLPLGQLSRQQTNLHLSPWRAYLLPEEEVVFHGSITKKKSIFSLDRKRELILTSLPRFVYVDAAAKEYKKDIPWDDIQARVIDDATFTIQTPHRTYTMKAQTTTAATWVAEIEKMAKIVQHQQDLEMRAYRARQQQQMHAAQLGDAHPSH